ncbi:MAG: hypothetical protein U9M98_00755 [Patescibacteria group bacterium]|nr:hypothetical protein [Patescibacteria group bacterium]
MIYILHGNNLKESREKLTELINNLGSEALIRLEDDQFSFPKFKEACEARGLFSKKSLVVVELESSKNLEPLKKPDNLSYLQNIPPHTNVIIWIGELLHANSKILKEFKKLGRVHCFQKKEDKPFEFLDALGKRSATSAYLELAKLRAQGEHPLKLVQLIAWELRTLISIKSASDNPGFHPYVYKKNKKIAQDFSQPELINLFEKVMEADLKMKTGKDERLVLDLLVDAFLK